MKFVCTIFILFTLLDYSFAQTADSVKSKKRFYFGNNSSKGDSLKNKSKLELSFGQNLLFISNSKQANLLNNSALVIPTNAILLFAEFRPLKLIRIPVFLNIATESKQFIVNGQLINERASPSFGTGVVFKLLQFNVDEKSRLELELGPLANIIFDNKNNIRVAPVIASRLKICRGENFIMYLGGNYTFGINTYGLLYGTGTIF